MSLIILANETPSNESDFYMVIVILLTVLYIALSVLFLFWSKKIKNLKTVSKIDSVRKFITPIFLFLSLGCATYFNETIITTIMTSTVRGSFNLFILYWKVLFDGTVLSTVSAISFFVIILTFFFVTLNSWFSSIFVFLINKRKRVTDIFNNNEMTVTGKLNANVSMVLPSDVLRKTSVNKKLQIMSDIYIQKRLTTLIQGSVGSDKPFVESDPIVQDKLSLSKKFTFISGEPGVGKSMFFIHYLTNYIFGKTNDFVIYYDLAQYASDVDKIECSDSDFSFVFNSYLYQLLLNKSYTDLDEKFLNRILKSNSNKQIVVILDSIDECHVPNIDEYIYRTFSKYDNVKVMIGTRYGYLLDRFRKTNLFSRKSDYDAYLINGYNPKEWSEYVETVVEKSSVSNKEEVKELIRKDISVMFYSEYLNPFMLRAITQSRLGGDKDQKCSPYEIISRMVKDIEDAKKETIQIDTRTLDIIGVLANINSNKITECLDFLLDQLYGMNKVAYEEELKVLKDRLYVTDSGGKPNFSSGILSDFYTANCIFDLVRLKVGKVEDADPIITSFVTNALLGDDFKNHYDNIIQFLMLIADQEENLPIFDKIIRILRLNSSSPKVSQKDYIDNFVFKAAESIYKFTAPRIKKDSKPLDDKIFVHDSKLMQTLYLFFFSSYKDNYINYNRYGYYDEFYRIVTIYGYHKEAILATLEVPDKHSYYPYYLISVIRDSYEACFFGKQEYFTIDSQSVEKVIDCVKQYKIDEKTANTVLIKRLLIFEFISKLTNDDIILRLINKMKEQCGGLIKAQMKENKMPHFFPYIFDLSNYCDGFEFVDDEVLFSDKELPYDKSSAFVVLDTNISHSYEASPILASLFITHSDSSESNIKSEIFGVSNSTLTTLMVSRGVNEIGEYQFDHCPKLRFIHLFEGLKKIGRFAFINCPRIQELIIPDSVTILEESFIEDAFSIKTIHLPRHFTIGNYPFEECCSLETISGGRCENLSDGMFKGCSNLIDFNFAMFDQIKDIPDVAFSRCGYRELIDLSVFNNLETIGNLSFSGNEIDEIIFPESLRELKMNVFYNSSVKRIVFNGSNKILISPLSFSGIINPSKTTISYNGTDYSIDSFINVCDKNENDFEVDGLYGSLNDGAFYLFSSKNNDNKSFTDLNLDNCLGDIKYDKLFFNIGCFGNHEYIQTLKATSLSKVDSLSRYMFEDNISLTDIDLAKSNIKNIYEGSFIGCVLLKNVKLSSLLEIIEKQAFYSCLKVKTFTYGNVEPKDNTIILPESLLEIGDSAFSGLDNIQTIIIYSNKVIVKAHALSNMRNLKTIKLPAGFDIKNFENDVFDGEQEVDIFIGDEEYRNGVEKVRIGAIPTSTFKQGLYPNSLIPSGNNLHGKLERYFRSLDNKEKEKAHHILDYFNGVSSDAHYWDIEYEINSKKERYRRLLFTNYRTPEYGKSLEDTLNEKEYFQELNLYEINEVYWFKFEPITWICIGRNSDGDMEYISEYILDSMPFNKTTEKVNNIPANVFDRSDVKKWLDEEFSNFIYLDQNGVNSILDEGDSYKLAFINKERYDKLKTIYHILKAKATNYASSQGTYNYLGDWAAYFIDWPDPNNEDCELYIKPDGTLYCGAMDNVDIDNFVSRTDGGVRPILIVKMK